MQQTPYQQMAKEFMDLWQKQLTTAVGDKQFIHAMLELFQSIQTPAHDRKTAPDSKPAHAADADHGMLAELAFRVAMCERRLAELEKRPAKAAGKSPARKSAARRSKKPRK